MATFSIGTGPLRTGVVLDDGRVVDIGSEAKRRGMKLAFDSADMISLIAGDDAALAQVREIAGGAKGKHPQSRT